MAKITIDELRKLAKLSNIAVNDDELPALTADIDGVLNYAARVADIAARIEDVQGETTSNGYVPLKNVFRPDQPVKTDPQPLLALAPERTHDFFVVPAIIENK